MSRRERLERWATVLAAESERELVALVRIEGLRGDRRRALRQDSSPLAIAFADPVLREQGLTGDTYGEIARFFELSDGDAHYLICDCWYHGTMTAGTAAARIRVLNQHTTLRDMWRALQRGRAFSAMKRVICGGRLVG
jgi:hypothetical protein